METLNQTRDYHKYSTVVSVYLVIVVRVRHKSVGRYTTVCLLSPTAYFVSTCIGVDFNFDQYSVSLVITE